MHRQPHSPPAAAFTLVEMLTAVTVLALIMLLLGAIISHTIRATNYSKKQMDATRQARTALDMLYDDLDHLVCQGGLATVFVKTDAAGNSVLTLITRRRGSSDMTDWRFLAVTYALDGTRLTRDITPVTWAETALESKVGDRAPGTQTDTLAEGVLRFEAVAQLDSGDIQPLTASGPWNTDTWHGVAIPDGFRALLLASGAADANSPRVSALTVAVATLDEASLRLPRAGEMREKLPLAGEGQTPLILWQTAINEGRLAEYPSPAVTALRILQRTYTLP